MTLFQYFNTPETMYPQELVDGRMFVAEAPSVNHQRVLLKLAIALTTHVEERTAGEVFVAPIDVILDVDRPLVLQPDLLFVSRERLEIVQERLYGAPDLVIEILSPYPRIGRIEERIERFAASGVREIWLYHQPERRMDILTCENGAVVSERSCGWRDRVASGVLPQFTEELGRVLDPY